MPRAKSEKKTNNETEKGRTQEFFRGAQLMVDRDEPDIVEDDFRNVIDVRKRLFLQYIAKNGPRYGAASKAAGVSLMTTWVWRNREREPVFMEAFEAAHKMGVDSLEAEFIRRGFHGVEKPVYQGGRLVGTLREYDTTAGIFMLKALAPERHRERYEHSGPGGGPMQHQVQAEAVVAQLTTEELRERLERMRALAQAPPELPSASQRVEVATQQVVVETPEEQAYAQRLADRAARNGGNGNGHGTT